MIVGSALMLLSSTAFASKSRLQALGEDKDGSYYISDYRNIFINPAELNSMGNMATMEWGKSGSNIGGALGGATLDLDNSTKTQGGVVYGLSNGLKLGVNIGDESDVAALTRILASNGGAAGEGLQSADNVLDVFVAGKAGVNWGANVLYSNSKSEATGSRFTQDLYAVRLGASEGAWNAHLLVALAAKADAPDYSLAPTYKGKLGLRGGGGYDLSPELKSFVMYETYDWDQANTTTASRKGHFTKGILGLGDTKKVNGNSTIFAKIQVDTTHVQLDAVGALVAAKIDRLSMPITFGFEHAANEWLTIRGSVVQNLYGTVKDEGLTANLGTPASAADFTNMGKSIRLLAAGRYGSSISGNGGKATLPNSTSVNAGAAFTFGSLVVDGNIGTNSASRASTTGVGTSNSGMLSLDNLESRVAVTYKF